MITVTSSRKRQPVIDYTFLLVLFGLNLITDSDGAYWWPPGN